LLTILKTYGVHAQAFAPELEKIAASFDAGELDFPTNLSKQKAQMVRDAIKAIGESTDRPELIHLH
jgi:hypothetical protein